MSGRSPYPSKAPPSMWPSWLLEFGPGAATGTGRRAKDSVIYTVKQQIEGLFVTKPLAISRKSAHPSCPPALSPIHWILSNMRSLHICAAFTACIQQICKYHSISPCRTTGGNHTHMKTPPSHLSRQSVQLALEQRSEGIL